MVVGRHEHNGVTEFYDLYLAFWARELSGAIAIWCIFNNMTSTTVVTEKSAAVICVWS